MSDDVVTAYREELLDVLDSVGIRPCSDGNCEILPPRGMHTNGGCQCLRVRTLPEAIAISRKLAKALRDTYGLWDRGVNMIATRCAACPHAPHEGRSCGVNLNGKMGYQKVECVCASARTPESEVARQRRQALIDAAQARADALDRLDALAKEVEALACEDRLALFRPYCAACAIKKNQGVYCPRCEG